jgi:hypothetical protein
MLSGSLRKRGCDRPNMQLEVYKMLAETKKGAKSETKSEDYILI